MKNKQQNKKTSIGGQAVMEGVMMRSKCSMATAVRDPQGEIQIESERLTPPEKQKKFLRLPFVRGVVNFISSLTDGNRILLRSAEVQEEDPKDDETAVKPDKKGDGFMGTIATIIGVVLALGLFIVLPSFLTGLLPKKYFDPTSGGWTGLYFNLVEGGIRLLIFLAYILLISLIPTLRRVFMYHGAEHKTITCHEKGEELTVENVKKCSRVHDRCGTTFLFLVVFISVLVFSVVNVLLARLNLYNLVENELVNKLIRIGVKILLLPFIASLSYEVLRLLSKTKSKFFLIFKFPGLLLQRLTTREPSDDMIECAIAAFTTVLKMDEDPSIPCRSFATVGKMSDLLKATQKRFADNGIDEEEAEWIFALTLDIKKSALASSDRILKMAQAKQIVRIADERLTGRPLWYIIGDADFCGYKIKVDERVLIPRPETEDLVMLAVSMAKEGQKILDLCTGSGAIAIATTKELQKKNIRVEITASDISEDALTLAKENAEANGAEVKFLQSDLFARLDGEYDLVISNPPYIPTATVQTLQREVRDFEPHLALDGGEDGLDIYRRIAEQAQTHIRAGGSLLMEVGEGEAADVAKLFPQKSMIAKDFNGVDRYVKITF
ncbi:MAG: peptide chain release factor N(5)-glutamine methyltransferase [Clostridia bacterium]|nr:peptide chain release factor N(5)-glutamine methyltransferase [Clostridia bacterium]